MAGGRGGWRGWHAHVISPDWIKNNKILGKPQYQYVICFHLLCFVCLCISLSLFSVSVSVLSPFLFSVFAFVFLSLSLSFCLFVFVFLSLSLSFCLCLCPCLSLSLCRYLCLSIENDASFRPDRKRNQSWFFTKEVNQGENYNWPRWRL
jgi:hypothetical protein